MVVTLVNQNPVINNEYSSLPMCLNFVPSKNIKWLKTNFGVNLPKKINEEVFPDYDCPIIRAAYEHDTYKCEIAHFGLIPFWSKTSKATTSKTNSANHKKNSIKSFNQTYNAKIETIKQRPSFRSAWSHHHFALVIVDSFYQYCYQAGFPEKWIVEMNNQEPFALACLWDRWSDTELGKDIISFTIITQDATSHPLFNKFQKPDEPKRAPIIVPNSSMHEWLTASLDAASKITSLPLPSNLIGHSLADPAHKKKTKVNIAAELRQ